MKRCFRDIDGGMGQDGIYLWLAGQRTDPESKSEFIWKVKSGSITYPMEYTNWDQGQPDYRPQGDDKEACLNIWPDRDFKWNDAPCSRKFCFVCEMDE